MSEPVKKREHVPVVHKDCHQSSCSICDGGLIICEVCGLAEGTLTTECPGVPSTALGDMIYAGELDYVNGGWTMQPTREKKMISDRVSPTRTWKDPVHIMLTIEEAQELASFLTHRTGLIAGASMLIKDDTAERKWLDDQHARTLALAKKVSGAFGFESFMDTEEYVLLAFEPYNTPGVVKPEQIKTGDGE